MQQRGRVHELHRRRQPDVALAAVAAQLGGGDGQHRPQPLAAGIDQMVRELRDQLDVGHRLVEDDAVDRLHVLGDDLEQRLQALCGIPRLFEWDDDAQGVLSPLEFGRSRYNRESDEAVKPDGRDSSAPIQPQPRRSSGAAIRIHA